MKLLDRRKHQLYCTCDIYVHITVKFSLSIVLQGPGPMAEINFWQERASIFSAMSEQLKQPVVKKILEVLTKADASVVQTMEGTVVELTKYRVESDNNARYLSTLERYFMVSCTF